MCAKNEDNTFRAHKDADCFSKTKSEGGGTKNIREGLRFIGLEIQEELAEMSRRSIILNGLEKEIEIVTGDIITATETFGNQAFDVITVNPPYMLAGHGIYCKNPSYDIAKHEIKVKLDDILRESAKLLKQGGRFYMVHRPYRLPEIFSKMVCFGIEPKRMRLVQSYADSPPTMVLIEGRNGGNRRLSVEPALILYEEQGVYTKEALTFYGDN
jgi:tRNA1Val (adenine37-N6)-methyltransferase